MPSVEDDAMPEAGLGLDAALPNDADCVDGMLGPVALLH